MNLSLIQACVCHLLDNVLVAETEFCRKEFIHKAVYYEGDTQLLVHLSHDRA